MSKKTPLTRQENGDFAVLKSKAHKLQSSAEEWHKVMCKIRDAKLYRNQCDTWEEFCKEEFGFSGNWANQLIAKEKPRLEAEKDVIVSNTHKTAPEDTVKAVSGPKGVVGEVIDPETGEVLTPKTPKKQWEPSVKSTDKNPAFKKSEKILGQFIRSIDEIGKDGQHDVLLSICADALTKLKKWKDM